MISAMARGQNTKARLFLTCLTVSTVAGTQWAMHSVGWMEEC